MSYENTVCPCGGVKEPGTMLCTGCETALKDHPSMIAFNTRSNDFETRKHAAMTLIELSRGRIRPRH